MEQKGISIESLKERIEGNGNKLSRTSISNIINDKTDPKVNTLQMIADALNVSIQQLFDPRSQEIHLIINNKLETFHSIQELKAFVKTLE